MQSIQTTDELTAVLASIDILCGAQASSAAVDELDALVDLVDHYEGKHCPIEQKSHSTRIGSTGKWQNALA